VTAVLGIDLGTVRIGVAASDPTQTLASPLITLKADDRLMANLAKEIELRGATTIVVGLPRNMDGTEGEGAVAARNFVAKVKKEFGLRVELWDERLTTVQAEKALIAGDVSRKKRKDKKDALAAAIMLQSWLDRR
jgi:putative Holliday junction resolvase